MLKFPASSGTHPNDLQMCFRIQTQCRIPKNEKHKAKTIPMSLAELARSISFENQNNRQVQCKIINVLLEIWSGQSRNMLEYV